MTLVSYISTDYLLTIATSAFPESEFPLIGGAFFIIDTHRHTYDLLDLDLISICGLDSTPEVHMRNNFKLKSYLQTLERGVHVNFTLIGI